MTEHDAHKRSIKEAVAADPPTRYGQAGLEGEGRREKSGWKFVCPFHADTNPSLHIYLDGGWQCFGCHAEGSTPGDLFSFAGKLHNLPTFPEQVAFVSERLGIAPPSETPRAGRRRKLKERHWNIIDTEGQYLASHYRVDYSDGSKAMWWQRGERKELDGLDPRSFPLYGAPELVALNRPRAVLVVEGEKACDAAAAAGLIAVGTFGTAYPPTEDALLHLVGHDVRLWPDNDPDEGDHPCAGQEHMAHVARVLAGLGQPCSLVEWPGAPPKGDAADFFSDGRTVADYEALPVAPYEPEPEESEVEEAAFDDACTLGDVLTLVGQVIATGEVRQAVFSDRSVLRLLARCRDADPATYALAKQRLKDAEPRLNLNDLERAARSARPPLRWAGGGDGDDDPGTPRLAESAAGYSVIRLERGVPVNVPLSNFVLALRERLIMPDGNEVLAVDLSTAGREKQSLDLPHDTLLRAQDLQRALRTSETVWLGTDRDVQLLRAHLLRQAVPRMRGVEVMGRHDGHIVLPSLTIGRDGPVGTPETRLVDLCGHALFGAAPREWPTPEGHLAAAGAIYRLLPRINQAHLIGGLMGWIFALPWAAGVRTSPGWGGFPHLVLWGTSGSGKTATAKTAWRLCGVPLDFEPFSLPGTRFTRLRRLACTNLIPTIFDEYRPGSWRRDATAELHHELRSLYGGELEERGTRALGSQKYHLSAPLILVGEDRPRDTALDQRMVVLHPDPDVVRTESFARSFAELHRAPLEAFCLPYWAWALAQDQWAAILEADREAVRDWAQDQESALPPRVLNNLAIVRFGWTMFGRYAEHLGLQVADLVDGDLEAALLAVAREVVPAGEAVSALDDLMRFVAVMVANGRLRYGVHFVEIGAGLVLPLREVLAEARRYARETEREQPLLGEDAYRGMVAEAAGRPNGYVIANSERGDSYNPSGGGRAQRRGVLIDVGMLDRKLEIDPEIWDEPTALPDQGPGK